MNNRHAVIFALCCTACFRLNLAQDGCNIPRTYQHPQDMSRIKMDHFELVERSNFIEPVEENMQTATTSLNLPTSIKENDPKTVANARITLKFAGDSITGRNFLNQGSPYCRSLQDNCNTGGVVHYHNFFYPGGQPIVQQNWGPCVPSSSSNYLLPYAPPAPCSSPYYNYYYNYGMPKVIPQPLRPRCTNYPLAYQNDLLKTNYISSEVLEPSVVEETEVNDVFRQNLQQTLGIQEVDVSSEEVFTDNQGNVLVTEKHVEAEEIKPETNSVARRVIDNALFPQYNPYLTDNVLRPYYGSNRLIDNALTPRYSSTKLVNDAQTDYSSKYWNQIPQVLISSPYRDQVDYYPKNTASQRSPAEVVSYQEYQRNPFVVV